MNLPDDAAIRLFIGYLVKRYREGQLVVDIPRLLQETGLSGEVYQSIVHHLVNSAFTIFGSPTEGRIHIDEGMGEYVHTRGGFDHYESLCTFPDVHRFFQEWQHDQRMSRLIPMLASAQERATKNGIELIKGVLALWDENRQNSSEEFWQTTFADLPIVLSQVFPYTVAIVCEKAYVGGKTVANTGGKIVDYLLKNGLTGSAGIIEIKTPMTSLVGAEYRSGVFKIHPELIGAVMQTLDYKHSLLTDLPRLEESHEPFHVFNPTCLVIAGDTGVLDTLSKRKSFALFRHSLKDVQIVGYDELFQKTRTLIEVLESGDS